MAVYYFVIGQDGSRYGPADVDSLVQWANEGRLVPQTTLIERGTDRELAANEITALAAVFGRNASPAPPAPGVRIERNEYRTMTHPGHRPDAIGASPPTLQPQTLNYHSARQVSHRGKLAAGLLGIFLGTFGIHRFYLGYNGMGFIQLLLGVFSCGISGIWGFVEGIIILTGGMPDADGLELRD